MYEQIRRRHQSFQYDFVADVQLYQFHEKLEKLIKKKFWITTNKKVTKKVV